MERPRQLNAGVLLGASQYSKSEQLPSAAAFQRASSTFRSYLLDTDIGLSARPEHVLDLFDSAQNSTAQLVLVQGHLRQTSEIAEAEHLLLNFFVFYVGHGIYGSRGEFALTIADTDMRFDGELTSLTSRSLAKCLSSVRVPSRRFILLDCAFAGAAAKEFMSQSSSPTDGRSEWNEPPTGVSILAATDSRSVALLDNEENTTLFSSAFFRVLANGDSAKPDFLTLAEIADLMRKLSPERLEAQRVFLFSPDQPDGDIATGARVFPNAAARRRQTLHAVGAELEAGAERGAGPSDAAFEGGAQEPVLSAGPSTHIAKDIWTTDDALEFAAYAQAIAGFITHPQSEPPLTISIQAPWGGGKTSLMRMVQRELDLEGLLAAQQKNKKGETPRKDAGPTTRRPWVKVWSRLASVVEVPFRNDPGGFDSGNAASRQFEPGLSVAETEKEVQAQLLNRGEPELPAIPLPDRRKRVTVWFNAWKYENTNQVWAGLVDAILQQVPERLGRIEQERFWLRLNLGRIDASRIRQKLHEYFFRQFLTTTAGLGWALTVATATTVGARLLPHLDWLHGMSLPEKTGVSATFFCAWLVAVKAAYTKLKIKQEPISDVLKDLVEVPKYDKETGFVHQVERDLRRVFASFPPNSPLVVFIDDLDRCSPPKVANVLEAINLFLAGDFPDCFFVLGMDTEMVAAALQSSHKEMTAFLPSDARIPIGWRFMDKFVQLPFVIPPIDLEVQATYLRSLMGAEAGQINGADASAEAEAPPPVKETPSTDEPAAKEGTVDISADGTGAPRPAESEVFREAMSRAFGEFRDDNPEYRDLLAKVAPIFHGNPRELKRFVNSFRFYYFLWYARSAQKRAVPSLPALVRWTAMSVKWPEHARWLRRIQGKSFSNGELKRIAGGKFAQTSGYVSHLAVIEAIASQPGAKGQPHWQKELTRLYDLKEDATWLRDESLFHYYVDECRELKASDCLSAHAGKGFW